MVNHVEFCVGYLNKRQPLARTATPNVQLFAVGRIDICELPVVS
jgi:hypothetical protein